jgi:hypothetical protein
MGEKLEERKTPLPASGKGRVINSGVFLRITALLMDAGTTRVTNPEPLRKAA